MSTATLDRPRRFIVALTGASGALYAERMLAALATTAHQVEIVPSKVGGEIFRQERGRALDAFIDELIAGGARMRKWAPDDFYAPFASGTQRYDGMAIVPCSAGALGRIAFGTSPDLVSRAADVCLKEGRPLVLLVRESPFSEIHLRNMLRLRRAGAVIMPASPAFYSHPKDLTEMADSVVQRVLDHLEIDVPVFRRWRERAGDVPPRGPRPLRARGDKAPPASGTDDPRP